jgi:ATP-binding protein involved in chromosome partitioning
MAVDQRALERAVAAVVDRELDLTLEEAGMVHSVDLRRHRAEVVLAVPVSPWPGEEDLRRRVADAASAVPGVREAAVGVGLMAERDRDTLRSRLRRRMAGEGSSPAFLQPGSKTRVIGISSGKGGVGKSSVTVNLAIALSRAGRRVGILDADVYGFSVPKMVGADHDPAVIGDMVVPAVCHGVRVLSMGFFVPDDTPVIWRGPMLHKAIEQFLSDAYWGDPDVLLVDMPPGTGDVTLSLAQFMSRAEVLVVTTPQLAAQRVAQRSAFAARKLKLSVRGVIENMSWFTADDGTRYELFGRGGGQALADDLGVPLLGQVPLVPALREGGDEGVPVALRDPDGEAARAFDALAAALLAIGPARVYRRELSVR